MTSLTSGRVARAAGIGIETIRFYERIGLLAPPPRTDSGYRQYPQETVERLRFIKNAQRLGFTLGEIAELLALHQAVVTCDDVKQRAVAKIDAIDGKVSALQVVKQQLVDLIQRCEVECTTSCTVMLSPGSCGSEEENPTCTSGF